jgi:hypothetical protein
MSLIKVVDSILADNILADSILAYSILADSILADSILAYSILADSILTDSILADSILAYAVPCVRKSAFCALYSYNVCDSNDKIFSLFNIAPRRDAPIGSGGKTPCTLNFDSKFITMFSFSHNHVNINKSVPTIHRAGWIPDPV